MRRVIIISLNGNAYQLEQGGYEALSAYLATAEQRLADNPDRVEVLADLEQAIADKCDQFLGRHKNVVNTSEVLQVIREMGPVDDGSDEHLRAAAAAAGVPGDAGAAEGAQIARERGEELPGQPSIGASGADSGGTAGGTAADPGAAAGTGAAAGAGTGWTFAGGSSAGADSMGGNFAESNSATGTGAAGAQAGAAAGEAAGGGAGAGSGGRSSQTAGVKRLYQIQDGAMISGVCTGLAAYFDVDVTIVRLIFIALAFVTAGAWIVAYIIMMFVIPYAQTSEQHAAAHGWPFNARELVERAKQNYAQFRANEPWRHAWRHQRRHWKHQRRMWKAQARYGWQWDGQQPAHGAPAQVGQAAQIIMALLMPVIALVNGAFFVAMILAIVSLASTHSILGWNLPPDIPLWVAILVLVVGYNALASPLKVASRAVYHPGRVTSVWVGVWGAVLWSAFVAVLIWVAVLHWPEVRNVLDHLPETLRGAETVISEFTRSVSR